MSFKCKFLARDKATAKLLVDRYKDLPEPITVMLRNFIDELDDESILGEGMSRVVDVYIECNLDGGNSSLKVNVSYRLVL